MAMREEIDHPPSNTSLLWLFLRWTPSALAVSLLTLWTLVMMGGIARAIGWLLLLFFAPAAGLILLLAVAGYALVRRRFTRPIAIAMVLSLLVIVPGMWPQGILAVPYPASLEDQPQLRVRVPTDEKMRVYWGGAELEHNYHALYPDQRWAYDLVIEPAGVGSSNLEDYGCWNRPVLAPISGVVSSIHDGEPDETPGKIAETSNYAGNHVVLKSEKTGTYLLIAHLARGSVAVKAGARVEEGDPIGRCGNSGRTSEPHVHLHHQKQEIGPFPLGLAEGLPLFFRDSSGPAMPKGGVDKRDDRIILLGDVIEHAPRQARSFW
jgi:hypothetical protein